MTGVSAGYLKIWARGSADSAFLGLGPASSINCRMEARLQACNGQLQEVQILVIPSCLLYMVSVPRSGDWHMFGISMGGHSA